MMMVTMLDLVLWSLMRWLLDVAAELAVKWVVRMVV